jgi:Leucine Rich repeat
LDEEGTKAICEALKQNKTLKELDLGGNELGAESGKAMVEALKTNTTLCTVTLDGAGLSIAELTTATSITLSKKGLGDASGLVIAHLITRNRSLTQLSLNGNQLGDAGGCALAVALQANMTLAQLDLGGNNLGPESGKAMGEALKTNTTLTQLSLNGNKLGEAGGCALAVALKTSTTLTQLSLNSNELGDASGLALAAVLSGRRFHWLDLSFSSFSPSSWDAIAKEASKGAFDRVTGMPIHHQLQCCLKVVDLTRLQHWHNEKMRTTDFKDSSISLDSTVCRAEGPLTSEEARQLSTMTFDDSRSVISSASSSPFKTVTALREAWRTGQGCAFCSGGLCCNATTTSTSDEGRSMGCHMVDHKTVCNLCSSTLSTSAIFYQYPS